MKTTKQNWFFFKIPRGMCLIVEVFIFRDAVLQQTLDKSNE
jgi:hypothetical protein